MITTDIPVATYGDPDVTMDGEVLTQETAQVYADSLADRIISHFEENGQVIKYRVLGGRLQSDGDFYNPHKGQVIAICEEVVNE